jgi:glycerol-3-phosphate acyltransferase PlsY
MRKQVIEKGERAPAHRTKTALVENADTASETYKIPSLESRVVNSISIHKKPGLRNSTQPTVLIHYGNLFQEATGMTIILAASALIVAYLLGSLPMGVFAARLIKGVEIREVGSGRTGTTNAYRAAGPWGAAITSGGDIIKGIIALWSARLLMMFAPDGTWTPWVETLAGIAAIVGHNWSVFLKFKGGAGTVTTIGVLSAINAYLAIAVTVTGIIALAISRTASIASITIAIVIGIALAVGAALGITHWAYTIFGIVAGALTLLALRPNIKRLVTKQERRLENDY